MARPRVLCLLLCLLAPATLLAQGRPTDPGGGPQLPGTTTPQQVVDSTGKVVGDVIKIDGAGISSAAIKYTLPNGDYVALSTTGQTLAHVGSSNLLSPESSPNPRVLFQQPDCAGDAFVNLAAGPSPQQQLTRRQGLILAGVAGSGVGPVPSASCPVPLGGNVLYASDPLACPVSYQNGSTITFKSFYGWPASIPNPAAQCVNVPAGLTMPDPVIAWAVFLIYRRIEDVSAKFTPPFYIP